VPHEEIWDGERLRGHASRSGLQCECLLLERINPTATLLEHALLTQGFMGGSKAGFLHSLQPQNRDSTRANLANTQKWRCRDTDCR